MRERSEGIDEKRGGELKRKRYDKGVRGLIKVGRDEEGGESVSEFLEKGEWVNVSVPKASLGSWAKKCFRGCWLFHFSYFFPFFFAIIPFFL